MKLDYFDLISPLPLDLVGIGRIKSPKLIEIADISYYVYAQYVSCLRMTPSDYIEDFKIEDQILICIQNLTLFCMIQILEI